MTLTPTVTFLIVLAIGALAGLLFDRFAGPNWFKRQIVGAMPSMITSALVGVAGAFVGFHLADRSSSPRSPPSLALWSAPPSSCSAGARSAEAAGERLQSTAKPRNIAGTAGRLTPSSSLRIDHLGIRSIKD